MSSAVLNTPRPCNNSITHFWERQRGTGITLPQPTPRQASDSSGDVKQGASKALRKRALLCCCFEGNIYRKKKLSVPSWKSNAKKVWVRPRAETEISYPQVSCPGTQKPRIRWNPCSHEVYSVLYQSSSSVMHSFVVFQGVSKSYFPKQRKLPLLHVLPCPEICKPHSHFYP